MTVPARIFSICARAADRAVVFRRGPSYRVQMLLWDLKTDQIDAGQWLTARVYEHRSDLSPDGRHLIFFAATHKGGPASNWTAISKPPYFTALHFYGCDHSWGGGGLFLNDRHYWMDAGTCSLSGAEAHTSSGLTRHMQPPDWLRPRRDLYVSRLLRDGWELLEEQVSPSPRHPTSKWIYTRDVRPKWRLIKTLTLSLDERSPTGSLFWETHMLEGPARTLELEDEWAEVHGRSVIMARAGRLLRMRVHAKGPDDPTLIADLNANEFRRLAAPYQGVNRVQG